MYKEPIANFLFDLTKTAQEEFEVTTLNAFKERHADKCETMLKKLQQDAVNNLKVSVEDFSFRGSFKRLGWKMERASNEHRYLCIYSRRH